MLEYRNLYADGSLGGRWLDRQQCRHAGVSVCEDRGAKVALVRVTYHREKSK